LIKRCSFFDLGRKGEDGLYHPDEACANILQIRELQLLQCEWEIRQALKAQEKAVRALGARKQKEVYYRGYCDSVVKHGIGDGEASEAMRRLIQLAKEDPDSVEEKPTWESPKDGKDDGESLEDEDDDYFFDDDDDDEGSKKKKRKTGKTAGKGKNAQKTSTKEKKGGKKGKKDDTESENGDDVDLAGGKSQPKTESVDEDIWAIREKTHAIKRLDKELVGRTRSLRFFRNVWSLQKDLSDVTDYNTVASKYECVKCRANLTPD